MKPPEFWTVPRSWAGQPAFILGGGPSVLAQDLSLLDGHRVIAINSAWRAYPQADVLFFADEPWWNLCGVKVLEEGFDGKLVTITTIQHARLLRLARIKPSALSLATNRNTVAMHRTSVAGGVNLAFHFGANPIALIGVDLKFAADGRRHHHNEKYPRPPIKDWQYYHRQELEGQARALAQKGVQTINCSPVSEIRGWRNMPLDTVCRA